MGETSLVENKGRETSAGLFTDDVALTNAEEWLLQADYAASKKSRLQRLARARRDRIKQLLIQLLPDVTDLRIIQAETPGLEHGVEAKTPYGWVRIADLSLGYKTLISWMVDLASRLFDRYPNSQDPLAEPAIVLVDEIDLHLHPRWQRTLMDYLSGLFPNTQFIATAHSPLIVQAAEDANVVLLRRAGDHVVIDNDIEVIRNWRVDQILTSDLFGLHTARPPHLDGLIAERTAILAKGRLTQADRERLTQIESEIGHLPSGDSPADMEAMDIIRRAAALLQDRRATG